MKPRSFLLITLLFNSFSLHGLHQTRLAFKLFLFPLQISFHIRRFLRSWYLKPILLATYTLPYIFQTLQTAVCPHLIENHPLSFTSDWELTDFQHSKNVRNPRVYKTILQQESVILQFPNYIDDLFFLWEVTTQGRLYENWNVNSCKVVIWGSNDHHSQENNWSSCKGRWKRQSGTGIEPLTERLQGAGQFWVCLHWVALRVVSRTESTWNVKSMTIYMAPERCNTNSEVNSSQMSCWRSTQRNRAANGYILVQVWIFLTSFLATAPAPSSMWWSL